MAAAVTALHQGSQPNDLEPFRAGPGCAHTDHGRKRIVAKARIDQMADTVRAMPKQVA